MNKENTTKHEALKRAAALIENGEWFGIDDLGVDGDDAVSATDAF